MMQRDIYIIDPLPNVANGVKRVLEGISNNDLQIQYKGQITSYKDLYSKLAKVNNQKIGLVLPVNDLKERPLLNSYRELNPEATVFDLLAAIQQQVSNQWPGIALPVVMPFLFEAKVDIIRSELRKRPNIKNTLACLVKYITGIDKTFNRNQIQNAFRQWFLLPEQDNYMMVDYLKKQE